MSTIITRALWMLGVALGVGFVSAALQGWRTKRRLRRLKGKR